MFLMIFTETLKNFTEAGIFYYFFEVQSKDDQQEKPFKQ